MRSLQPERALRLLDSLDGLACALRLAWSGYRLRRLALGCALLVLLAAALHLPAVVT